MFEISRFIDSVPIAILAGIVGTAGMTFTMYLINRTGIANARMVIAVGSIITKSREKAIKVGLIIHFAFGIFFGMIYTFLIQIFEVAGFSSTVGIGFFIGCIHGFVMSFILVIAVAEHHPLEEFRDTGFAVAFAHVIGHMVYGTLVGLIVGESGIITN
jgi:uncharacterized membrane protein YagU involved in acid resistance